MVEEEVRRSLGSEGGDGGADGMGRGERGKGGDGGAGALEHGEERRGEESSGRGLSSLAKRGEERRAEQSSGKFEPGERREEKRDAGALELEGGRKAARIGRKHGWQDVESREERTVKQRNLEGKGRWGGGGRVRWCFSVPPLLPPVSLEQELEFGFGVGFAFGSGFGLALGLEFGIRSGFRMAAVVFLSWWECWW